MARGSTILTISVRHCQSLFTTSPIHYYIPATVALASPQQNVDRKDGPRAWLTCLGFHVAVFLNFGTSRTLGILLADWQEEFQVSNVRLQQTLKTKTLTRHNPKE